tara:strand:+ start:316 stop:528 length:213 start_codon:yes stop_codon:yes gene_type:complete
VKVKFITGDKVEIKHIEEVEKKMSVKRLDICKTCERFESLLSRCKECKCFMKFKVYLANMDCPLGKWELE